ncbi:MAG: hypothetical protein AAGG01_20005, partial [Planctomycetota bacterium]
MSRRVTGLLPAALRVAAKELFEGFRDRQTVLYTFVLPLCMYPALFWIMVQGVLVVQGQKNAKDVTVAVVTSPDEFESARLSLLDIHETEENAVDDAGSGGAMEVVALPAEVNRDPAALKDYVAGEGDDVADAVLVLSTSREEAAGEGGPDEAQPTLIYYDSTDSRSDAAFLRSRLAQFRRALAARSRAISER